jgi:Family of unknown function (DUF5715)
MKALLLQGLLFSGQSVISGQPRAGLRWGALAICLAGLLLSAPAFGAVRSTQKKSTHKTASSSSTVRSRRHSKYGKLWSPLFPGSHDLLVEQNAELDRLQIPRMNNEYELIRSEMSNDLVPVNETESLRIAENLTDTRRYCRPWTRDFLQDLSQAFYEAFHAPLQVNSLVRTADQQRILRRHNRFAAPEAGETASTHIAGVTVDLSRRGLSNTQYQWIRSYLMPLQQKGMINPIEERQPVLHIVVFEKYSAKDDAPMSTSEASEPTEFSASGMIGSQP